MPVLSSSVHRDDLCITKIDPEFEEVTEGEEENVKRNLMSKWSRMEAMVGTEKRLGLIAQDIVDHFAKRLEAMEGKAMVVCMSRRICVDLYKALTRLRPEWHHEDDDKGEIKIVMTGSEFVWLEPVRQIITDFLVAQHQDNHFPIIPALSPTSRIPL